MQMHLRIMPYLTQLNRVTSSHLFENIGWMLASEGVSRATRLLTIIALAAFLTISEYGIAMLALACHELFRVFMRAGAGPKIIQCSDAELPLLIRNGAALQWIIFSGLMIFQFLTAPLIGHFYGSQTLSDLLQLMALSYCFYPIVSTRVFMLQRLNMMRDFSIGNASCVIAENIGCAVLLCFGFGIYSIAIAKIIAAIAWFLFFYRAAVPRYGIDFHLPTLGLLTRYSFNLLGTEILRSLRTQIDVIIAGRFLSPEFMGVYSFARSAGVGLSQSLSSAYLGVLYPHICKQMRNQASTFTAIKIFKLSAFIGAIFVLQALLAPFYIQWLFASQWHDSSYLVSMLCLTAIPALLVDTKATLLRAQSHLKHEFLIMLVCILLIVTALLTLSPSTPFEFAMTLCVSSILWCAIFLPLPKNAIFNSYNKATS